MCGCMHAAVCATCEVLDACGTLSWPRQQRRDRQTRACARDCACVCYVSNTLSGTASYQLPLLRPPVQQPQQQLLLLLRLQLAVMQQLQQVVGEVAVELGAKRNQTQEKLPKPIKRQHEADSKPRTPGPTNYSSKWLCTLVGAESSVLAECSVCPAASARA